MNDVELLRFIAKIAGSHCYQIRDNVTLDREKLWISSLLMEHIRATLLGEGLEDMNRYIRRLNSQGLRSGTEWNRVVSLNDVRFEIKPLGIIELHKGPFVDDQLIDRIVGEYEEYKLEIENEAVSVIKERLRERFEIVDVRDGVRYFDIILIDKKSGEPREQRLVEVKSWRHIGVVILTDHEKAFGESMDSSGGNYWLYIVDLRKGEPHIFGYRRPFSAGALKLIKTVRKGNRTYYVYWVDREADEKW